jgi:hypothetical protein
VCVPVGARNIYFLRSVKTFSADHRGALSPGRESDHSPSSSSEVRDGGAIPPLPHTCLWLGAYLIKRGDSFVFIVQSNNPNNIS